MQTSPNLISSPAQHRYILSIVIMPTFIKENKEEMVNDAKGTTPSEIFRPRLITFRYCFLVDSLRSI